MITRFTAIAAISAAISLAPVSILAQAPAAVAKTAPGVKSTNSAIPRLPDGRPDIGGFWSNNTATPFQRPPALAGKEFVTDEEAKTFERNARNGALAQDRAAIDRPKELGNYNSAFLETSRWALPNNRSSIITDPKDGRLPPMTAEAKQKFEADKEYHSHHVHDGPEDMTTIERCITWITSGPPMLPSFYNNNYQIVQNHYHVVILAEMVHDVRIIPIDGSPHESIPQWMGDSRGHWEGDTLVVETTNFNGKRGWWESPMTEGSGARRLDKNMRVTERFTRTAPGILLYQFTVNAPDMYTAPWSGEIPMRAFEGPVYEYGCHEGNYGMSLILSGARAEEKKAESKQ
jgi:hypothetical protein